MRHFTRKMPAEHVVETVTVETDGVVKVILGARSYKDGLAGLLNLGARPIDGMRILEKGAAGELGIARVGKALELAMKARDPA